MAELAIPLIALGSMYIISKQTNDSKENFTMMGKTNNLVSSMPPEINYPISSDIDSNNVMKYNNANQTTDSFFNQNTISQRIENMNPLDSVGGGVKQVLSLNGEPIINSEFKHNNMVPFFGSKIKGASSSYETSE